MVTILFNRVVLNYKHKSYTHTYIEGIYNACMCIYIIEVDLPLRSMQIFIVTPGNQDIGYRWEGTNLLNFYILVSIPNNLRFPIISTDAYDMLSTTQSEQIIQLLCVST